jgi:triphosphatase
MNTEFELKLDLEMPKEAEALAHALELGAPRVIRMRSVYFDTPDLSLAAIGYSLRIRHEGRKRIQTLKAGGGAQAGLFARSEWEQPARGRVPRLDPDSPVVAALGDRTAELRPRMEVEVTRSLWMVETGDATIEMVLDRGEVRAGEATAPISEIELELKDGDVAALFALARRIGRLTPVRIGVLSKAERGQRLLRPPGDADKAQPVALAPDMTAGEAFRAVAHACIRQYRLNESRLVADDNAKALHQARVALRRLRSAISAFRPIVNGKKARRLNAELRWLTRQLGDARNIDVLIPRVRDKDAQAQLRAARAPAYATARRAMASDLTRELMIDLVEWLDVGKWTRRRRGHKLRAEPSIDYATRAIGRLHGRLLSECDAIAGPDDEARHELRKTAKKLRYTTEAFALLFDEGKLRKARLRYAAGLEKLQDELGALNDLAIMPGVLESLGLSHEQAERAFGDGSERHRLIRRAGDAAALVAEAKRFWA